MKKRKKHNKKIILIIILILVLTFGITKFINSRKQIEVANLENETTQENKDETQKEENKQETEQEQPKEEEPKKVEEPPKEEQPKEEEPKKVEETPKKVTTGSNNGNPYYIKINNQANVVTIYAKDEAGNYTVPYKAMVCSIGKATPQSGVYKISNKYTWRLLEGNVYGQYACRITGHILFHSVPYTKKDKGCLEYWEYDKLGTKASAGCIRLTVQDAKWIYDNCKSGTKVEFYSDSNPGPLGKPTAQKISADEAVRGWDPTDPDKNNPWKNYVRPTVPSVPEEKPVKVPKVEETPTTSKGNTKVEQPKVEEKPTTQVEKPKVDEPTVTETKTKPAESEKTTKTEDSISEDKVETVKSSETKNSKGTN